MTERQPYSVERETPEFEIRSYPEAQLVQVDVAADFEDAGNLGFRPLVSYISGNNAASRSIAMTAPVIQQPRGATSHTVSFVMPSGMTAADIPRPNRPDVRAVTMPEHRSAVQRFRGSWSAANFERHGAALRAAVEAAGLVPSGEVYFARFDPPWTPPFLRRNEAIIDLVD